MGHLRFVRCLIFVGLTSWGFSQRIVSLAPNLTEIVCELGLCKNLVGVTEYCVYPAGVKSIPRVGGYINPNIEVILSMQPDLVLAVPEHRDTVMRLERLGLKTATIKNYALDDIFDSIEKVGALTKNEAAAGELLTRLKARQAELTKKRAVPPRCLLTLDRVAGADGIKEVYIVGQSGFLNDLVKLAGGVNVWREEQPVYPKLSQETILRLDPDIIIELLPTNEVNAEKMARMRQDWLKVTELRAAREGHIYILQDEGVLTPGPRYLNTLETLVTFLDKL